MVITWCVDCLKEATTVVYALNKKGYLNRNKEYMSNLKHIKKYFLKFYKFEFYFLLKFCGHLLTSFDFCLFV